ncbi:hypothetical protein FHG87_003119 [Trinorchestia longiramus]|nr:hypothetical protein FHG87_003119 [Trinorchestia longiramus]
MASKQPGPQSLELFYLVHFGDKGLSYPSHFSRVPQSKTAKEMGKQFHKNRYSENTNTPTLQSENTNTPTLQSENTNTPTLQSENTNTPTLQSENTNTPTLQSENTNTPTLQSENTSN